jgi:two-component system NtrC family sensor kinase
MQNTSGVLVVGHPRPERMDFGADSVANFKEARIYLETWTPSVLVFGRDTRDSRDLDRFCAQLLDRVPLAVWIMNTDGIPSAQLIRWINFGRLFDVVDDFEDPDLTDKVRAALEASGEESQNLKLVELFAGQSQQLRRLTGELETRVRKRHKTLAKSLHTLEETKTRLENFHKALLGIHRASSINQMERTLNEALADSLSAVRIRFEAQSLIKQNSGDHVLAIELPLAPDRSRGEVLYFTKGQRRFARGEVDFFHEITEALALALGRLHKLEQAETLRGQWQATFDSIPHPLCLTTPDHEILKLNRAFRQACANESATRLAGRDCFEVFFGRAFTAPIKLDTRYTFRHTRPGRRETEHFEVFGQTLGTTEDAPQMRLVLIRPITEEVRFERRILEAAKLAELGTIGSSIAHELNNPLGGMLSFLQLILMDLKVTDPLHSDVKSMENAVLRCRDIVLNLLSFARKQDFGNFVPLDLGEMVARAIRLIELQSKSMGVEIEFIPGPAKPQILGSADALTQAVCNLLQNSIDAIAERMKKESPFSGKIRVRIDDAQGNGFQLRISDNGTGIRPDVQTRIFNPLFTTRDPGLFGGMGLTTAFTIVTEHQGSLEILSQDGSGTTAILSLPRLDLALDPTAF